MRRKQGFTLIELLIVIAIIALLAAILFPVFATARESARRASCAANLKQMGLAMTQYTQDYDEFFPSVYTVGGAKSGVWKQLQPYIKSEQIFTCPSDEPPDCALPSECPQGGKEPSYSFNTGPTTAHIGGIWSQANATNNGYIGTHSAVVTEASRMFLASDGHSRGWHSMSLFSDFQRPTYVGRQSWSGWRHRSWRNVVFVDGHVKPIKLIAGYQGGIFLVPADTSYQKSYCMLPESVFSAYGGSRTCAYFAEFLGNLGISRAFPD